MSEEIINTEQAAGQTAAAPIPAAQAAAVPAPIPQGKVFGEEYVQSLREEAKTNRLLKKQREAQLRNLIGLKDDEDITDSAITAFVARSQSETDAAIAKANERLILAAIRGLAGYDAKLLERLIDKSKLKINDDGDVEGLVEAAADLEKEFPQVKVQENTGPGPNPAGGAPASKTDDDEYKEIVAALRNNPGDRALMQRLFIIKERMKK